MRKLISVAAAVAVATLAAGCGSGSVPGSGSGSGAKMVVGTIPNPSDVSVYLAKDKGYFKDAGLEVQPKIATGFAPNLAAVVNGESKVGFAAVIPLMVAKSKGAPIKIISGTDAAPKQYDAATDPDNVYAMPSSGINSPKDLAGKKVAVNALGSIQDLGVKIMVKNDGGDPNSVKFLALPSNDMLPALKAGRVDAAALSEPFSSDARAEHLKALFSYVTSPTPGAPVGAYFTSRKTLTSNGDQIDKFVKAIDKATTDAQSDPQAVQKTLGEYTQIPAKVLTQVHTFPFETHISDQQISTLSKLLVEYGYMKKSVSAQELLR